MTLRYYIPFADNLGNKYRVEIHREDYAGEAKELTGATSCFVVSGTDEDFIYTPMRPSSATISVLDSDLLLDLYSINNQYAPVKLFKNDVLEWTGYIKPEQFTQPYVPVVSNISVECVCALSTLENVAYEKQTDNGFISLWELMKYAISKAKGGYKSVFIPWVYSKNGDNLLQSIEVPEENFTSGESTIYEVLEEVCKFLGWTLFDMYGNLYFVDSDWKGIYRQYDEALSSYSEVEAVELQLQDIGFINSDANNLDIVPGYNKATVKSINNTFDEVIKNEDYDELESLGGWVEERDGVKFHYKRFYKPKNWKVFSYNSDKVLIEDLQTKPGSPDVTYFGAVLMKEAIWEGKEENGTVVPNVSEYPWDDCVQMRYRDREKNVIFGQDSYITEVIRMEGATAVWANGAISISGQLCCRYEGLFPWDELKSNARANLLVKVRIGNYTWTGEEWVEDTNRNFELPFVTENEILPSEFRGVKETKNPDLPYSGLSGYIIPLPETPIKGDLQISVFIGNTAVHVLEGYGVPVTVVLKDLQFNYAKKDGVNDEGKNGDRIYQNVVNEAYMSACDEIEFNIGSYNNDGATYSKALLQNNWLTDNLYCAVVGGNIRPEELMIRRIVNRYEVTKIKLTEGLRTSKLVTPLSILTERTQPGRLFRLTSGEWDYEQGRMTIQIQEDIQ